MIKIKKYIKSYPSILKFYESLYLRYSKYIEFIPLWIIALKNRKNKFSKKIFFYPEKPIFWHVIYQICIDKKIKMTDNFEDADLIYHFKDITFRTKNSFLGKISKKKKVINHRSFDISKTTIGKVHKKAFGYEVSVNPKIQKGLYLKKSNLNSSHDGKVLSAPEKPENGFVYQKLINNVVGNERIELRIPVFGNIIPFVYVKHRPLDNWFASQNKKIDIASPKKVLSKKEISQIIKFCSLMGLDHCELDVLRDKDNGKLYIVDANNTPASPPTNFDWKRYEKLLRIMSDTFVSQFMTH